MPGYIDTRPLASDIKKLRAELDKRQETTDGIKIEDADLIMKASEDSIEKENQWLKDYKANKKARNRQPQRGAVYNVFFSEWAVGSEIRSKHPALIITADWMRSSDTLVVIPTTSASARKERILDKRSGPKEKWDDEAWCCIPIRSNPATADVKFIDLKQMRVISFARFEMLSGKPVKLYTLTDDCMRDVEESMMRYFNMQIHQETVDKYENTMRAKQQADRKIRTIRRHMFAAQSALQAMQENPNLDSKIILENALNELHEALDL